MMSVQTRIGLSLADFIQLYDEAPFELIDGERIPLVPGVAEHGEIIKGLYRLLLGHEVQGTISVYSEMPFVITYNSDWVTGSYVPDIMVYGAARIQAYKAADREWRKKPFTLVPDLCIEVISPGDRYIDVDEKVERYLSEGVKLVWVVNPRNRSVTVYTVDEDSFLRLGGDKMLTGGEVMPDFTLRVSDIFANLQV